MNQSGDPFLQDPVFKRSGKAPPGESARVLIQRYRAGMLRRTEADPAQAGKKTWVEASSAYALAHDKLQARHRIAPCQVIITNYLAKCFLGGVISFKTGAASITGTTAEVPLALTRTANSQTTQWTDHLILR